MAFRAFEVAISGVGHVSELVIGEQADDLSVCSSLTGNALNEIDGNTDWHGYYVQESAIPSYYPNDEFTLTFDLCKNAAGPGGHGDVIVESVRVDWAFRTGAMIRNIVKFGATGEFVAGLDVAVDNGPPVPKPALDGKIQLATAAISPVFTTLGGVVSASLFLSMDSKRRSHSGVGGTYTRFAEPFGWAFAMQVNPDDTAYPATIGALNGDTHVRAFIDSTLYYDVQWIKWKKLGELKLPVGGREYASSWYTGNGASYVDVGGARRLGLVTSPGGIVGDIWGTAWAR